MKNIFDAYEEADQDPIEINNHLMIATSGGTYLATIDASEGKKWRLSSALMVHGFNNLRETVKALSVALEVIRDCDMPKTYHRTKAEIIAEIEDVLEKANNVKEIGDFPDQVKEDTRADIHGKTTVSTIRPPKHPTA